MKVLIISANTLPASPTGPAYMAGAALKAGHEVEVFDCLFGQHLDVELKALIDRFRPDVIGVSIRLVHGYLIDEGAAFNTRRLDLRSVVKQVVDAIRQATGAPIVLGGPGFNYFARDWLEYLGLEYGIRGEADISFPLYLDRLEQNGDLTTIPGCILRQNGQFYKTPRDRVENLDEIAFPAYELFDMKRYRQLNIAAGIQSKRGCAFDCVCCPYHSLEGGLYRLKSPARIAGEIKHIRRAGHSSGEVVFCENNFNVPRQYAEAICNEIIAQKLDIAWSTGDLRPMGIDDDFCRLLRESGCASVNLSVESGSEAMLRQMRRGYGAAEVEQSLICLARSGIPFSVSLMIGAPGENPATVKETLALIDRFSTPLGVWVTIGICLWTPRQGVLALAQQTGQLTDARMLFEGAGYLSPALTRPYMEDLIAALRSKYGYTVQANQPYAGYQWENVR